MMPDDGVAWLRIAQHTFAGLSLGSILVLLALGLSIIFGLMRVINLAHGEFMMVGAYTTFVVAEVFKPYVPAALFDCTTSCRAARSHFCVAGAVGWLCEVAIIRHLYGRPIETLLATWGISLLLIQTARLIFGDTTSFTPPHWLQGGWEIVPGLVLPLNRLFIIVFCGCAVGWCTTSFIGRALECCCGDDAGSADCSRARCADQVDRRHDVRASAPASPGWPVPSCRSSTSSTPTWVKSYVVDSFMVVVVGGVGKLAGAIVAGSSLGFLTKYIEPWLEAVYGKLAVLAMIILFLQWRPSGLFPRSWPARRRLRCRIWHVLRRRVRRQRAGAVVRPRAAPHGRRRHRAHNLNRLGRYLCFAIAALGIDLIWGYAGVLSLCHALFFCLGGYAIAMHLSLPRAAATCGRSITTSRSFSFSTTSTALPDWWPPFASLPVALIAAFVLPALLRQLVGFLYFSKPRSRRVLLDHHAGSGMGCVSGVFAK